jgi:hypothetical protein
MVTRLVDDGNKWLVGSSGWLMAVDRDGSGGVDGFWMFGEGDSVGSGYSDGMDRDKQWMVDIGGRDGPEMVMEMRWKWGMVYMSRAISHGDKRDDNQRNARQGEARRGGPTNGHSYI